MARFVVPVVVLVALVGGYVAGQQPSSTPPVNGPVELQLPGRDVFFPMPRPAHTALINDLDLSPELPNQSEPRQVGRYVPAGGRQMLDTTNGTLYAVSGDRWQVVATLNPANEPSRNSAEAPSVVDPFSIEDPRTR